jgi:tetratricopeptide (TPR) repeat protein
MRIAVLPFTTGPGVPPEIGRQFAAFAAEQLRAAADADVQAVSYLSQIEQEGVTRVAFANIEDDLLPYEQMADLFAQGQNEEGGGLDLVQDGRLTLDGETYTLILRFHGPDNAEPASYDEIQFGKPEVFAVLHRLVKKLAFMAQVGLPEMLAGDEMAFGTENPDVFWSFLGGFDALNYINQANGAVALEFNPEIAIRSLESAMTADPEFLGPYHVLVQLCRACANYRIGTFELIEEALKGAAIAQPAEAPAFFAQGELYQAAGDLEKAANAFEKSIQKDDKDPGLYTRLGIVQAQMGMPVNAERNFRRAMELEDDDKPSADMLANVLGQTNRSHEIPPIWKAIIDANPQNAAAHAKYAISLLQNGKTEEGERAFETALETVEESAMIKRYYAPYLVSKDDLDRAMDFYEDALDEVPNDVPTLIEYAQTLERAGRQFEVPDVLKQILNCNPEPDIRAETLARLIELEQPKRVETVDSARLKMEAGDFQGAIRELKPLRNWLADYWKLYALLASAYNRTEQYEDALESAIRLLELFPGCEPAFGEYVMAMTGLGRTEEAYNVMKQVAIANPSSLPIHINFGLAASRAGHSEEARALAKQIREAIGPNEELEPVLAEIER